MSYVDIYRASATQDVNSYVGFDKFYVDVDKISATQDVIYDT